VLQVFNVRGSLMTPRRVSLLVAVSRHEAIVVAMLPSKAATPTREALWRNTLPIAMLVYIRVAATMKQVGC
jgi:hypothetical protein